ncbi:unnamed protein product [Nippostrongylus brasiliensis]|uniref:AA_permease_C domain-containing protein n=1 Tax=Nippostrongylus brasiliensis TaxID=27835 RepID=A0A158R3Q0_NIPBR|nr:unnamed protein product [Nippostrongylus brasiliensis]
MFSVLNVPAARYMLTVSAVCGLSGAVLSSFLPGSRIINALNADRLLPLPADMTRRPVMSVFIFFILVSFGLLIHRNVLLHVVLLTTPLKMLITVCMAFLQHYRVEPVGIPQETSHYKAIRKKRQRVSVNEDNGSVVTSTLTHDDDDDDASETSVDTSVLVHMAVAKKETQRLQRRLEKVSSSVLLSLFFVIVLISLVLGSRLITNDNSHSRRQATVPLFPHLTYFTLFILVFVLATTKFFTFALFLIWMFIGLVLYFMYGYWNSSERFNTTTGVNHDEDSDMYRAIIGNDYAIQFE